MSQLKLKIDNGYFFILSLFIFILNSLFITVFLAQGFKNTIDLFSYFFTIAGFLIIIKTFIVGYANLTYSIRKHKWYVLIAEILLISTQLASFFLAVLWFKIDTYPKVAVGYFFLASCCLIAQLVVGKLTQSIKYQLVALFYYGVLYGTMYVRLFNADIRYLQITSVIAVAIEIALALNIYRTFQNKEIIKIKELR